MKSATASHHLGSFLASSLVLPFPPPTYGYSKGCAGFCVVHPSHTQLASSALPIVYLHHLWGSMSAPSMLSGSMLATLAWSVWDKIATASRMPAGVAISCLRIRFPTHAVSFAFLSASSFPFVRCVLWPTSECWVSSSSAPSTRRYIGMSQRRDLE